ncbi:MAG: fibronectin type III domain-containing protein, partial [Phycisphaerales bacterium]|nr:fibronectin type III domain-containing protein [Phycisphaerales bacterium]
NDAGDGDSAATYETNITALINTLITTHGATASQIYLAYPTHKEATEVVLATYNTKVDTMRTSLGLAGGPDYYNTFENYHDTEYADDTHPNTTGFVRMARLAALSMAQPTLGTSTYGKNINLTWNNMATLESTVAGYRVNYGTDAASLTSTVDVGNALGYVFTSLTANTTYYFTVSAYDNDATDISYSDASAVSGGLSATGAAAKPPPSAAPRDSAPDYPSVVRLLPSAYTDTDAPDTSGDADIPTSRIAVPGGAYRLSPFTGLPEIVDEVMTRTYIRGDEFSTVYYVDDDAVRHPFLDVQTFATYDVNFSYVARVSDATLPEMTLGVPMLPKAGTILVKIMSDPRVYAVEANPDDAFRPFLRWIPDEATARTLYGDTWAASVIDVEPTMFARFGSGATIDADDVSSQETVTLKRREDLLTSVV